MEEAGKSGILTAAPPVVMGQFPGPGLAKRPGFQAQPGLDPSKGMGQAPCPAWAWSITSLCSTSSLGFLGLDNSIDEWPRWASPIIYTRFF